MHRPDPLDELDTLFGPAAVLDLDHRGLLARFAELDTAVTPDAGDRIHGALLGAAIGNALGFPTRPRPAADVTRRYGKVTGFLPHPRRRPLPLGAVAAEGRLLVSWAGLLGRDGRTAAPALAGRLASGRPTLRAPGQAIVETVERLQTGVPWYAAGPDSFGNGALLRAVADGARWVTDPAWRPRSAALGAVVTHAHPDAVAASVALAELVAAGIADPDALADPWARARDVPARPAPSPVADALHALPRARSNQPVAHQSLARALHLVHRHRDPRKAVLAAVNQGGASDVVAGIVGALVGARHGVDAFPDAWLDVEHAERIARRAKRLAKVQGLPVTTRKTTVGPRPKKLDRSETEPVHLWYLIDRSGSMAPLQTAVIEGFNGFLAEQEAMPGDARLTLVQFDGRDPYEVLVDGARLETVAPLTRRQYRPRASTPLYDAMGSLIDAAEARIAKRARRGRPAEDQLVVVFTDGLENASRRWDRTEIFARIEQKKAEGWTFVYLGANQDSYEVGHDLGVAAGSVSNWAPSPAGYLLASESVSRAAADFRGKSRRARHSDRNDFFGGVKEAEAEVSPPRR